ncbi:MAG: phosphate acyltransferase [Terracidiphilus sp.]|nr:phosphate acyltransferase [Terracidiphilus sp.]MDR3776825.1 phosphate acyltransferase [Terracidiphilus sp.]
MEVSVEEAKCIRTFADLRKRACDAGPKRVAVVLADDEVALTAAADALHAGIALPILIGDETRIRAHAQALGFAEMLDRAEFVSAAGNAAEVAVRLAREGAVDVLLKGHLRTDELLHPVLNKEQGLRTGRLLSDIAFFETDGENGKRLVGLTDGGLNVAPTLEQKKQIALNAIEVLHCLGIQRPKVAIMSAVEVVTEAMPSTLDGRALTELCVAGDFGEADVFGPLALDNALFEWAAKAKGIAHPVAGHADCLVVPNIEAGNLLAKSIIFLAGREYGHIVVGAKVPILIPSRVENAQDKVNAIALGVLYASR